MAPRIKERWLLVGFTALLLLRLGSIAAHHAPFEARWRWIAKQMKAAPAGQQDFYLTENKAPMDTLLMSWGLPYESLIVTRVRQKTTRTLLIHPDMAPFEKMMMQDTVFITPFRTYSVEELNGQYFPLGKGRYTPLK